jgi:hypothetical protein
MNIVILTINQVEKLWEPIRYSIIEAVFPRVTPEAGVLQEILCMLLKGQMQCWCIHNDENKIYGYVVTSINDEIDRKVLLIYSEYLSNGLPDKENFREISDKLESFAKENNCHRVIAYSANPNAISIAKKLGYSDDYVTLVKEV